MVICTYLHIAIFQLCAEIKRLAVSAAWPSLIVDSVARNLKLCTVQSCCALKHDRNTLRRFPSYVATWCLETLGKTTIESPEISKIDEGTIPWLKSYSTWSPKFFVESWIPALSDRLGCLNPLAHQYGTQNYTYICSHLHRDQPISPSGLAHNWMVNPHFCLVNEKCNRFSGRFSRENSF